MNGLISFLKISVQSFFLKASCHRSRLSLWRVFRSYGSWTTWRVLFRSWFCVSREQKNTCCFLTSAATQSRPRLEIEARDKTEPRQELINVSQPVSSSIWEWRGNRNDGERKQEVPVSHYNCSLQDIQGKVNTHTRAKLSSDDKY